MSEKLNVSKRRSQTWYSLVALCAVLAVGIAAYSNSFSGPFVLDDLDEITLNPHARVQDLSVSSLWNAARQSPSHRRPVANVTLALNYYLGEYDVAGYHLVNLAIHLACGMLVYVFAAATFSRTPPPERAGASPPPVLALTAALVFVSHPLQTQAVTYVVQRMTSLAVMWYLAALVLYIHGRTADTVRRRWLYWSCGVACGVLALGTKEIAATLPVAVLLYEWYFFQNLNFRWLRRALVCLVPALALLVGVGLAIPAVRETLFGGYAVRDFDMPQRLLTECRVLVYYLSLVVWPLPSRLSITHDILPSQGLFEPITTLVSLLTLLGLMALAVVTARRYRIVSFGIAWFILQLAIESSVLPLELAFEHRMYLPMVGLSLMAAWGLWTALGNVRWYLIATGALVLMLATATHERNRVWQDDYTLWNDVVEKYPHDARAHNNLGIALDARNDPAAATKAYSRAIELRPEYADALNNLGSSLTVLGLPDEALALYRRALEVDPNHPDAHYNLGIALSKLGQLDEAIAAFRQALELRPWFVEAHNNLGFALDSKGQIDAAIEQYRLALDINPRSAEVLNNLGVALAKQGDVAEAIDELRKSLAIQPDDADTHYNLGNLLALQGQNLDAQIHLRRALELALAKGDQPLAQEIQKRLQAYPQ